MKLVVLDLGINTGIAWLRKDDKVVYYRTACVPLQESTKVVLPDPEVLYVIEDFPVWKSVKYVKTWIKDLLENFGVNTLWVRPDVWMHSMRRYTEHLPKLGTPHERDALWLGLYTLELLCQEKKGVLKWDIRASQF